MDRGVAWIGLPAIAMLAVLAGLAGRQAPDIPADPLVAETTAPEAPDDRAETDVGTRLLEQFYGRSLDDLNCDPACPWSVIIAGVPDPFGSRLDWMRDANLEAIRRGSEASGYVFDRFELPGPDSLSSDSGPTTRRIERKPGGLLFRKPIRQDSLAAQGDPEIGTFADSLLVVYVVHERPTAGVYPDAFHAALDGWEALTKRAAAGTPVLPLLAPTFSGSSSSYRRHLEQRSNTECAFESVQWISGSATSRGNQEILTDTLRLACGEVVSHFHATQTSDDDLLQAVLDLTLAPLGLCNVVLLRETTTAFGQSAGSVTGQSIRCTPDDSADDTTNFSLTQIPFPMNISRLYGEIAARTSTASGALTIERAQDRTSLTLADRQREPETPQLLSELSPAVLEVVLRQIGTALRSSDVDAVGILATDDRDKLFLAERVRPALPDVQLFTLESNALLLRRDYTDWLHGMVVASTYPLVLRNQWWTQGNYFSRDTLLTPERMVFANDRATGVFNATLALLGRSELLIEYEPPGRVCAEAAGGAEYSDAAFPPIWLTVVSRSGFAPLRCRYQGHEDGTEPYLYAPHGPDQSWPMRPPADIGTSESFVAAVPASTLLFALSTAGIITLLLASGGLGWAALEPFGPEGEDRGGKVAPRQSGDRSEAGAVARFERVVWESLGIHWNLYAAFLLIGLVSTVSVLFLVTFPGATLMDGLRVGALLGTSPSSAALPHWVYSIGGLFGLLVATLVASFCLDRAARLALKHWDVLGDSTEGVELQFRLIKRRIRSRFRESPATREVKDDRAGVVVAEVYPGPPAFWFVEIIARFAVVLGVVSIAGAVVTLMVWVERLGREEFAFLAQRIQDVGGTLSPMTFLAVGAVTMVIWAGWHMIRIRKLQLSPEFDLVASAPSRFRDDGPILGVPHAWTEAWKEALENAASVRWRLYLLIPDGPSLAFLAFNAGMGIWLVAQFEPTLEGAGVLAGMSGWFIFWGLQPWEFLLRTLVVGSLFVTSWSIYRLLVTWLALRSSLRAMADTPLAPAFERLPRAMSRVARLTMLSGARKSTFERYASTRQAEMAALLGNPDGPSIPGWEAYPADLTSEVEGVTALALARAHTSSRQVGSTDSKGGGPETGPNFLERLWRAVVRIRAQDTKWLEPHSERSGGSAEQAGGRWTEAGEELLAIHFLSWVNWSVGQLRALLVFILAMLLLSTALISSYPFTPQSIAKVGLLLIVLAAVSVFLVVLIQFGQDALMSRLSHTPPGQLNFSVTFLANLLFLIVLPIMAVLSSEFPEVRDTLFAWIGPLTQAFGSF